VRAGRGRVAAWIGAVVLAAGAGLVAGKLIFDSGTTGTPRPAPPVIAAPETLPEASQENASATLAYLEGDGRVLLEITGTRDQLRTTVQAADPEDCRGMAAELSGRFPADTVLGRLQGVPDPVLGEWLSTYWGTAFGALQACADRDDPAPLLHDADTSGEQVDRRIRQLEEAR